MLSFSQVLHHPHVQLVPDWAAMAGMAPRSQAEIAARKAAQEASSGQDNPPSGRPQT